MDKSGFYEKEGGEWMVTKGGIQDDSNLPKRAGWAKCHSWSHLPLWLRATSLTPRTRILAAPASNSWPTSNLPLACPHPSSVLGTGGPEVTMAASLGVLCSPSSEGQTDKGWPQDDLGSPGRGGDLLGGAWTQMLEGTQWGLQTHRWAFRRRLLEEVPCGWWREMSGSDLEGPESSCPGIWPIQRALSSH